MQRRATKIGIWALCAFALGGVTANNVYHRYLRTAFERAFMNDDAPAVERLLDKGVSPNEPIQHTPPLLLTLSRYQRSANPMSPITKRFPACEDIALLLIKRGANIEAHDGNKQTPLLAAVIADAKRVVRELLDRHADLTVKDGNSRSALHAACSRSSREVVQWLVESGCDVNAVDVFGWTPLFIAAQEARTKSARLLVEHGAKINLIDSSGLSPFYFAVAAGSDAKKQAFAVETAKYLLSKGADPKTRNKQGQTVATLATTTQMMTVLESVGIPFPASGSKEEAIILGNAIFSDDVEMTLRCKASIPLLQDESYVRALQMGQRRNHQYLLNLLSPYMNAKRYALYLSHNVMSDAPAVAKELPQMIREGKYTLAESVWQDLLAKAISANRREAAKAILEKGISLDYLDKSGRTPTIEAALSENPLLVKDILERHPDVNRKTVGGISALAFAKRTKKAEVIRLLEAAGAKD